MQRGSVIVDRDQVVAASVVPGGEHQGEATLAAGALMLAGCETTNSIPYKASTANVISIQQSLQSQSRQSWLTSDNTSTSTSISSLLFISVTAINI